MNSTWACLFAALALTAANNSGGSTPAEQTVGVPVTLGRGITQTVEQIVARDRLQSTEAPMFPDAPQSGIDAMIPGVPDLPQTVGTNFKAVAQSESGFIPPDTAGDVGPTQVLVHVNGRIKVFSKAGVVGALNVAAPSFWAPVAGVTYAPQVRYDRLSGRWYVIAVTTESENNTIVIAVSSGPTITNSASFTFYSFAVGAPSPQDLFYQCDGPSLGIDAQALYVGCNMFSNPFFHATGFVIRKSSVLGGGPLVVTGFAGIDYVGTYTPQGVDNDDPNWTEGYFVGPDFFQPNMLNMWRVSDPGGVPSLGERIHLATTTTSVMNQSVLGAGLPLFAADLRLFAASIHKNKLTGVTSLWTAHSIETDTTCTPADSGNSRRLGAKWYEIGDLTGTPRILQNGTLCTTTLGSATSNTQRGFLYPTVTETGQGHMALGATYASSTEFAGIASAGRVRTDPAGATRAPETVVLAGLGGYQILDTAGRNVWGLYSFTSVDPSDDQTVWTFQEYADTASTWSVRAVQLKAPPPPNLLGASNSVCVGATAIPVTIFGSDSCAAPTCSNGLCTAGGACPEFFDPGPDTGGPGYTNHLSASVNGGVTVNSTTLVIPADPSTQRALGVALSLNTTAATAGTKVVTITNPDGNSSPPDSSR